MVVKEDVIVLNGRPKMKTYKYNPLSILWALQADIVHFGLMYLSLK